MFLVEGELDDTAGGISRKTGSMGEKKKIWTIRAPKPARTKLEVSVTQHFTLEKGWWLFRLEAMLLKLCALLYL